MRTGSCKAKGRRCAVEVKELLEKYAPDLRPGDLVVTPSGVTGPDLLLSPAARELYPFTVECKNQEAIQIWAALKQAESHAADDEVGVLFFRRNRSKLYVAMDAEQFVRMVR